MYKYEILLHGFGLAKQDLNFWNSNGDFRICSYVGYSNSIDEVLAGELEFLLFTSTKKKRPGWEGMGSKDFTGENEVTITQCNAVFVKFHPGIVKIALVDLLWCSWKCRMSITKSRPIHGFRGSDTLLDFWRVKSPHPCTEGLHERLKHGAQVYWSGLNRDRHAYN